MLLSQMSGMVNGSIVQKRSMKSRPTVLDSKAMVVLRSGNPQFPSQFASLAESRVQGGWQPVQATIPAIRRSGQHCGRVRRFWFDRGIAKTWCPRQRQWGARNIKERTTANRNVPGVLARFARSKYSKHISISTLSSHELCCDAIQKAGLRRSVHGDKLEIPEPDHRTCFRVVCHGKSNADFASEGLQFRVTHFRPGFSVVLTVAAPKHPTLPLGIRRCRGPQICHLPVFNRMMASGKDPAQIQYGHAEFSVGCDKRATRAWAHRGFSANVVCLRSLSHPSNFKTPDTILNLRYTPRGQKCVRLAEWREPNGTQFDRNSYQPQCVSTRFSR